MKFSTLNKIVFFLGYFIFFTSNAQELPPIKNYTPTMYGAENQNWAIAQSSDNFIYVGNNKGLLEFNGAEWKLYPSPNKTIIRSLTIVDDLIYTGAYMEFGFWKKNDFNDLEYTSLSEKLKEPFIEDEQIWRILKFDDWILFQSLNRIYLYDTISKSFQIINSETVLFRVFKSSGNIYYQKKNDGLYKIEHGKEVLVSKNEIIQNDNIINIFEVQGQELVLTQESGFYFLKGENLIKWNISASSAISQLSVYSGIKLKNGNFILGTISNGIYELNKRGDIVMNINQSKGLNNNTVLSMFEDKSQNLWLGLDNGISLININSSIKVYNDIYGKLGTVYASSLFDGKLYLGTNQGLFYKKWGSNDDFTFIEGTEGQVWSLEIFDKKLFCGHNIGTFLVEGYEVKLISNVQGTWDIEPVPSNENLLLQGNYDGVYVLEKKEGNWQLRNKIQGFDNISSMHILLNDENHLFVSHESRGVIKLKIDDDFTKVIRYETDKVAPKGFKSSIVKYNNNIIYVSEGGVFKYSNKENSFQVDSLLSLNFLEDGFSSGKFIVDNDSNTLWGFTQKSIIYFTSGKLNENLKMNKIPLPNSLRKNIVGYENLTHLNDQNYLFGTSRGYMILNLDKIQNKNFIIEINSIEKSALNSEKEMVSLSSKGVFDSKDNNLYISYSVPEYDEFSEVIYSYRLKGIYKDWSSWSEKPNVSFENLPFGSYLFEIKAQMGNKLSDNIAVYSFKINRPWYISNSMIGVYSVIFILLLVITNAAYQRRFNKQKQELIAKKQQEFELSKLESEKVIIELKNDKLQHDIDSKTKELSASTMSIIKKNELLNSIKKELSGVEDAKGVKPVIKIINKNLVNNSDWELFQEAFNNADRDFLKKIKLVHPLLTPNDLRLCTYLRLNLSSKEIAPLLNISPRSVEIKRYRLRKKMDLLHEKSLVEYILEV